MPGKGAWRVASYEIDMHENLLAGPSLATVSNALTESTVLHARQLCEIFLSCSRETDNIKLAHLVPESEQSERLQQLIHELDRAYGKVREEESARWVFNKMLLHPTTERSDSYNYERALNSVRPILKQIIAEIESIRGQRFDRRLRG